MKRLLARLKKDERGLTLVELLAVVVILAIVGGIAFVMVGNVIENSRKDAHIANALQLIAAAKIYEANGQHIITGTATSGSVTLEQLKTENLLGSVVDPWDKASYTATTSLVTKAVTTPTGGGASTTTYSATLVGGTGIKCAITAKSEEDLLKGRKTICP